jgi:predicted TIM-barrel fold metal-dependent hydrolase
VIFATDYPHWDYGDPTQVLPMPLPKQQRRDFFFNNAMRLYQQG